MAMTESDASGKRRKFEFKSSQLSGAADRLWKQRQTEFEAEKPTAFQLDLKKKHEAGGESASAGGNSVSVSSSFVFGARVGDRVVDAEKTENGAGQSSEEEGTASETPKPISSLFKDLTDRLPSTSTEEGKKDTVLLAEGLKQSAEAVTERKRAECTSIPEPVDVTTGEEDERNLLHIPCKIHLYDAAQKTWLERGNGTLRVNDRLADNGVRETRLVGRTSGNQRVLLNSKMWPEMVLEKASAKRIKVSALNPGVTIPQLFLITGTESSINELFDLLEKRLSAAKASAARKRKAEEAATSSKDGEDVIQAKKSA